MSNYNQMQDHLNLEHKDMEELPTGLNVLTILTYIGCVVQIAGAAITYFTIGFSYKTYQEFNKVDNELIKNKPLTTFMNIASDSVKRQYENRTLILVAAIVFAAVCFYGALQMRNKKMMGYNIYIAGEMLYPLIYVLFVGFLSGWFLVIASIIFIILYTLQRKHLVN